MDGPPYRSLCCAWCRGHVKAWPVCEVQKTRHSSSVRSLAFNCSSCGAHTVISSVPLRPSSVLTNVVSCRFPILSCIKRRFCGRERWEAGGIVSRVSPRTSFTQLSHSILATLFRLSLTPPKVCHCSYVRSQLGCSCSCCQSPYISLHR